MAPTYQATNTDLYQLTMAAAYFQNDYNHPSTFELFVRKLPENRSFLVAAGIEQCLEYLTNLKFEPQEIDFLKNHHTFKNVDNEFFNCLTDLKFTGDVYAMEEGNVFFPNEPVLRITAPAIQAQIVETYLLSMFNFQTLIASKAARIFLESNNKGIIEFGTRRAHSPEAGLLGARAAYVGGCVGTSNVKSGMQHNIPIFGTMAHSWVMSFETEKEAFDAYSKIFPDNNVLLIDTYDTIEAAKIVAELPYNVAGVRLDSGDFEQLSKQVREILDNAGRQNVKILVSGDMNEYKIKQLLNNKAPIDLFGVGTELATSKDAPALSGVYKLVENEIDGQIHYKAKFSKDKKTYPAKKQVYRYIDNNNQYSYDLIALQNELDNEKAIQLLKPAVSQGQLLKSFDLSLYNSRQRTLESLDMLPEKYRSVEEIATYPVKISERLELLANQIQKTKFVYA